MSAEREVVVVVRLTGELAKTFLAEVWDRQFAAGPEARVSRTAVAKDLIIEGLANSRVPSAPSPTITGEFPRTVRTRTRRAA